MPKVSVIVPVYNAEKYVEECICSVLQQTYENWELILIDDGSTDASGDIFYSFAKYENRIRTISQVNKGVSAARNTGIEHATGDYIMFLDSDDTLEHNAISILLEDIVEYQADIASALKIFVNIENKVSCQNNDGTISVYSGNEMVKRSLCNDNQTRSACAKLFSKGLIEKIRFADGHNINEDGFFMFECYTHKPKVVHHNVGVYNYISRKNSASQSGFSEKYLDMLYFCNLKMKYISENIPEFIIYSCDMEIRTHLLFLDVLCKEKTRKYKKYAKKSVEIVKKGFFRFHPQSHHERLLSTVVAVGMYGIYRILYRLKGF